MRIGGTITGRRCAGLPTERTGRSDYIALARTKRSLPSYVLTVPMWSSIVHPGTSAVGGAFMLCGLVLLGCAVTKLGATTADLARARDQAAPGATTYASECAQCHGQRGQGLAGIPAIMGPGALPKYPRYIDGSYVGDPMLVDDPVQLPQRRARPGATPSGTPRIFSLSRAHTCPGCMRVSSSRVTTGPW